MDEIKDLIKELNGFTGTLVKHETRITKLETSMAWVRSLLILILGSTAVNIVISLLIGK